MTTLETWMQLQSVGVSRLAQISGVSTDAVTRLRDGSGDRIDRRILFAIAGATGLSVEKLLTSDAPRSWSTKHASLDAMIRSVFRRRYSPNHRAALIRYMHPRFEFSTADGLNRMTFEQLWRRDQNVATDLWSILEIVDAANMIDGHSVHITTNRFQWANDSAVTISTTDVKHVWILSGPARVGTVGHPVKILRWWCDD